MSLGAPFTGTHCELMTSQVFMLRNLSRIALTSARDGMPPVKLHWYDGGLRPPKPRELTAALNQHALGQSRAK